MSGLATDGGQRLVVQFFVNFVHQQGTYFRFHNLAIGLTRLGHQVTVYAGDNRQPDTPVRREVREGVPYHIVGESRLHHRFGFHCDPVTAARRFARGYPPCDVAHLFQPFPSATAGWLRVNARVKFYDWDDLWSGGILRWPPGVRDQWQGRVVRLLEGQLPRWADHVTAISQPLADRAREGGAKGVTLLNSGSWPAILPIDRASERGALGLRPDALYAGFMGRTSAELPWCFDALAGTLDRHPRLRLAVCGPTAHELSGLSPAVRGRIDYLGQLPPERAKAFAACIDLGLLPMADTAFNRNRLPQKFGDHLAAGVPLLCSTVGECGRLVSRIGWTIPAGCTHTEWLRAFGDAIDCVARGGGPAFDPAVFREYLSWDGLSRRLADTYRMLLTGQTAQSDRTGVPSGRSHSSDIHRPVPAPWN